MQNQVSRDGLAEVRRDSNVPNGYGETAPLMLELCLAVMGGENTRNAKGTISEGNCFMCRPSQECAVTLTLKEAD